MSREATLISIPKEHLPATICRLLAEPGDNIIKTQPLLRYEYIKRIKEQTIHPKTKEMLDVFVEVPFVEELKSPAEGELEDFYVSEGDTISSEDKKPVVGVKEPCFHSVQLHGLCAICGNDMMKTDFTGVDYSQRATISMAHNVAGLTVSLSEAERLEKETSTRLLKSRKLSLIVDLDQTLIHATVDSKVEDWMKDESNVTAKDIHKFILPDSPTIYYIKLRPGLQEFLKSVSDNYEPHIYTMGTRNYASSVANVIDPDKTIFNERILSRDESGSMTQKNIRRLFPCNDSMVVVIDDRADVWGWSPNLIKVHPYDFFVGIGDINDVRFAKQKPGEVSQVSQVSHLPASKEENLSNSTEQTEKPAQTEVKAESITEANVENLNDSAICDEKSPKEPLKLKVENNKDSTSTESILKPLQNNKRTHGDDDPNPEEKILKKQQLERDKNKEDDKLEHISSPLDQKPSMENERPVLVDNDTELPDLLKALKNIHKNYYEEYDRLQNITQESGAIRTPDLTELLPRLKKQVLKDVNILFTHVIPTHQRKESSEIWILATEFGAQCSASWDNKVTHLVAGDRGTEKVREAKRRGNVFIVSKE
ncbi:14245_t:CDS:10, partial [Acaulospora morrowiae]